MKNKFLLQFFLGVFLVLAVSMVFAANNDRQAVPGAAGDFENGPLATDPIASATPVKNMTYGLCVSELTKQRNTCYKTAKTNQNTCQQSANKTKVEVTRCRNVYKDEVNACKKAFKDSKIQCKQYKKTFADKLKVWQ